MPDDVNSILVETNAKGFYSSASLILVGVLSSSYNDPKGL